MGLIQNKALYGVLRILGHSDWLRYGIRSRVLRALCNPEAVGSYDFEVDFFGLIYTGNLNSFIDWIMYFFGAYEKAELLLLRDLVKDQEEPVFVDVGANVGQHTLFMSKYCKTVHSFEPYDVLRTKLQEKIFLNNVTTVIVHDVGLGEKDEKIDFFAPVGANKGTGSFVPDHEKENNKSIGKLLVVKGDNFFKNKGIKKISLIKIDVEGFEKFVLVGLQETLRLQRPIILMEFSETTQSTFSGKGELLALLPEGYTIKSITSERPFMGVFNRSECKLLDFDFKRPSNILAIP